MSGPNQPIQPLTVVPPAEPDEGTVVNAKIHRVAPSADLIAVFNHPMVVAMLADFALERDPAPTLVLADFLSENGNGDWAELIRLQNTLAELKEVGEEPPAELVEREVQLRSDVGAQLIELVRRSIGFEAYKIAGSLTVELDLGIPVIMAVRVEGEPPQKFLPVLKEALGDPDSSRREAAAKVLWGMGGAEKVVLAEPLADMALVDADSSVRQRAAVALGCRNGASEPVLKKLIASLGSPDRRSALNAATAFRWMGESAVPAIPEMMLALQRGDWRITQQVAWALGRIGHEASVAIPALAEVLSSPKRRKVEREAAAFAIGEIKGSQGIRGVEGFPQEITEVAVTSLGRAILNGPRSVATYAALSLAWFGKEALPVASDLVAVLNKKPLLGFVYTELNQNVVHVLTNIGPEAKAVLPILEELLNSRDLNLRREALRAVNSVLGEGLEATMQRWDDFRRNGRDRGTLIDRVYTRLGDWLRIR